MSEPEFVALSPCLFVRADEIGAPAASRMTKAVQGIAKVRKALHSHTHVMLNIGSPDAFVGPSKMRLARYTPSLVPSTYPSVVDACTSHTD